MFCLFRFESETSTAHGEFISAERLWSLGYFGKKLGVLLRLSGGALDQLIGPRERHVPPWIRSGRHFHVRGAALSRLGRDWLSLLRAAVYASAKRRHDLRLCAEMREARSGNREVRAPSSSGAEVYDSRNRKAAHGIRMPDRFRSASIDPFLH